MLEGATVHAIIARSPDGRLLSWNAGAQRLYGFEAGQAIGRHGSMLWSSAGEAQTAFLMRCEAVRASGKWEGELERQRQDGTRILVAVTLTARSDEQGQLLSLTEVSRTSAETRELQTERTMRARFAKLSHDLRTPLNGIIGLADLLHRGKLGEVPVLHQEYLGDILTSARALLAIVNDCFESPVGGSTLPPDPIDARDPTQKDAINS